VAEKNLANQGGRQLVAIEIQDGARFESVDEAGM
jgi:hypothetical protein